jgi:surfeit locus 1 family protein
MFFRTILGLAQTSRRRLHSSARLKFWFLDPSKKSVPTIYKARQEPWLTPTMVLLGIMPIFTFALGTWQLKRLKWKINLIDELEEKLHSQPLRLPPSIKFSTFLLIKCQLTEVNQSRSYT